MTSYTTAPADVDTDPEERRAAVQAALLGWWDAGHRDLPWRRTTDPYAILVSETMLQQTQAERVAPKYEAFLARFPTLAELSAAPAAEVIRAWAGLGYNRRAVNLHRLARQVVEQQGGRLPESVEGLLALPGIGPYTARAVASIAFAQAAAAVDTNVRRVLTRILDGTDSTRSPGETQALADAMLPVERPGAWNETLMELGATVCTAATPRCSLCPVQLLCAAAPAIRQVRDSGVRYRAPRRAREQAPFTGSDRFYRGRIIDVLRSLPSGEAILPLELGRRLRLDFGDSDLAWLHRLLIGLQRDGLVMWGGEPCAVRLPVEG